jgi:aminoglycoside phosphotransferase (APT) family kinase protein
MEQGAATVIDAAWLSAALGSPVRPVTVEALGDGVGLLASLFRVGLDDGRRLVVKLPSSDPAMRAIADRFGYPAREAGAYQVLLAGAGIATPRCHAVVESAHGPALVLDDLFELRPGDQLAGATSDEAHAAVDLLARLHAAFWDSPVLAACPWLPGPTDPVIATYRHLFELTWDAFVSAVAGEIPEEHLSAAERAIERFDDVCASFAHAPRTLLHGDYRLDNLLFGDGGAASVVDWQLAAWGRGAYDLALFCAGSLETAMRRAHEDELVRRYHAALVAAGVEGYELAACHRDYRLGHVLNLPNPVTALVAVAPGNARGAALLAANARRALAAVADHEPSLSFA